MTNLKGLPIRHLIRADKSNLEYVFGISSFVLVATVLLLSTASLIFASGSESHPSSISTSNITDTSFTISWKTSEPSTGYIVYGKNPENLNLRSYDNQTSINSPEKFKTTTHAVTLTSLSPASYYYYKIISGNKSFDSLDGNFFEPVKTLVVSPLLRDRYQDFIN